MRRSSRLVVLVAILVTLLTILGVINPRSFIPVVVSVSGVVLLVAYLGNAMQVEKARYEQSEERKRQAEKQRQEEDSKARAKEEKERHNRWIADEWQTALLRARRNIQGESARLALVAQATLRERRTSVHTTLITDTCRGTEESLREMIARVWAEVAEARRIGHANAMGDPCRLKLHGRNQRRLIRFFEAYVYVEVEKVTVRLLQEADQIIRDQIASALEEYQRQSGTFEQAEIQALRATISDFITAQEQEIRAANEQRLTLPAPTWVSEGFTNLADSEIARVRPTIQAGVNEERDRFMRELKGDLEETLERHCKSIPSLATAVRRFNDEEPAPDLDEFEDLYEEEDEDLEDDDKDEDLEEDEDEAADDDQDEEQRRSEEEDEILAYYDDAGDWEEEEERRREEEELEEEEDAERLREEEEEQEDSPAPTDSVWADGYGPPDDDEE